MKTGEAIDPRAISRKTRAQAAQDSRTASVLGTLLASVDGRQWLWDLLASCSIFSTTFAGDPLHSAFAEGRRAVGLSLLEDWTRHCPHHYLQAMEEANARLAADERRRSPVTDRGDPGPGSYLTPEPSSGGDPAAPDDLLDPGDE